MRVVGLTGGIACGKSLMSERLVSIHNVQVIDCDKISRVVMDKGKPAYKKIVKAFADHDIVLGDGSLNRKKLGSIIFGDPKQKQKLVAITGPAIFKEIFRLMIKYWLQGIALVIIDAPTLYETKTLVKFCACVITVAADDSVQLERLKNRDGLVGDEAKNRLKAQMPVAVKAQLADYTIWNNGSKEAFEQKIDDTIRKVKEKYVTLLSRVFYCAPGMTFLFVLVTNLIYPSMSLFSKCCMYFSFAAPVILFYIAAL